jgi:transcriptional regulator with XRE-family HTH domain
MARRNVQLAKRFGRVLRAHRTALGLSQEALAHEAELTTPFISQLENGLTSPSLSTLAALAKALNTTAATLVAEAERSST